MNIDNKRKLVLSVFGVLVALSLAICFSVAPIHAQNYEYFDGKRFYDGTKTYKDNFPFDEKMIIDRTYYPMTHELLLEIWMPHKTFDEELVEFGTYCAIMNFIEDDSHRYYGYRIVSRNTQNNKNGTIYDLRTVRCVLKE